MSIAAAPVLPQQFQNVGELLHQLGNVPPERVRLRPAPGTATEADLLAILRTEKRACELIDGVLVEKAMGYSESLLAGALLMLLRSFIHPSNLGLVSGEHGLMRLFPGLVRIPDVAFVSWERIPGGRVPRQPIPTLVPDLAIEVLSISNTDGEMELKRQDYFRAGVRLVWEVDPVTRTVAVYTAPDQVTLLTAEQTLTGDPVLPGFTLSLSELFGELDRTAGETTSE